MHTVLRSATREVVIGPDQPFCIIGERINPTGRPKFQEQLRAGDLSQIETDVRIVYLEDIRPTISLADRLRGLATYDRPLVRRESDDPAAILFTSGSEGTPKGVVLSHRNILANAAQAEARIDFGRTDKVFNVLPVFHSFGLTIGLILPLVSGVRV